MREGKQEGERKRARESEREQERVEEGTTGMLRTYANSEGMILEKRNGTLNRRWKRVDGKYSNDRLISDRMTRMAKMKMVGNR